MKSLVIDTATEYASVGFFEDNTPVYYFITGKKLMHLTTIFPVIEDGLKKLNWNLKEIEFVGVDIGPGSFTGIRIGVTTARTIAQNNNCLILGVSSLDLLAFKYRYTNYKICPVIDGRKNRVYTALFEVKDQRIERKTDYLDLPPEELKNIIKEEELIFCGTGIIKYSEILKSEFKEAIFDETNLFPEAKNIFYMQDLIKPSKEWEKVLPLYVRLSDAEVNLLKKKNE